MGGWTRLLAAILIGLSSSATALAAPPPPDKPAGNTSSIKSILTDELAQLEKDLAARMMRRNDHTGDRRARVEMEIDLRIIHRAVLGTAAEAKAETQDQAVAWARSRQIVAVIRGLEDTLAQEGAWSPGPTQKDAMEKLHKLSYSVAEIKGGKELDDFCRSFALGVVNVVNATPVSDRSLLLMRPKPIAGAISESAPKEGTLADLTQQVQRLAAVSVTLRGQLMSLAQAAGAEKEGGPLTQLLSQAVTLTRGLQSNTAVGAESRGQIETQLAEGLVLYQDERTRAAGKSRIDSLAQYRQVLGRIGRMSLTQAQMEQLAPALTWAQANGDQGMKLLTTIEHYIEICSRWDSVPREVNVMPSVKRALEDLISQYVKHRAAFLTDASKIGSGGAFGVGPTELEQHVEEMRRLNDVAQDVAGAGAALEVINSYKVRPAGQLEMKIPKAALAAAAAVKAPARNDADKYLHALRELADYSKRLTSRNPADVPPGITATWAGGKLDAFDAKWKATIVELAGGLITGNIELDKAKVAKLDTALAMWEALKEAGQLEAALAKVGPLARWVDWGIDPAALSLVFTNYREGSAGAFAGYATDNNDMLDRWHRLHSRYAPLTALVVRDSAYAEPCAALPIGFAGDVSRLATPMEGVPFGTERYAAYAVTFWALFERAGDYDTADRIATTLAKRIARDLRMKLEVSDEAGSRRRPR